MSSWIRPSLGAAVLVLVPDGLVRLTDHPQPAVRGDLDMWFQLRFCQSEDADSDEGLKVLAQLTLIAFLVGVAGTIADGTLVADRGGAVIDDGIAGRGTRAELVQLNDAATGFRIGRDGVVRAGGPPFDGEPQQAGLGREALARAADVPYSTVVKVETGQIRNPSWSVVIALAKAVSADLDVLAACPLPTDPGPGRGGLRKKNEEDELSTNG